MNKIEFENLMTKIKDRLYYYEQERVSERLILVFLANGDKLKITFPESSIAHFLGININYLKATGLFKGYHNDCSTYDILNDMCNNEYFLYNGISRGDISEHQLFSDHIDEKLSAFEENLKVNIFAIDFICKYDKSKAYYNGENGFDFDYIIGKEDFYGDKGYYILGLTKNKYGNYVPRSNQYFANRKEAMVKISDYIKGQVITYANAMSIVDWKSFYLSPANKEKKVSRLMELARENNAIVDVASDYKYYLAKNNEKMSSGGQVSKSFSDIIADCFSKGALITPQVLGLADFSSIDQGLNAIIMSYNNFVFEKDSSYSSNDTNNKLYSNAIEELDSLKQEALIFKQRNSELEEENAILRKENIKLTAENSSYKEATFDIEKIVVRLRKD